MCKYSFERARFAVQTGHITHKKMVLDSKFFVYVIVNVQFLFAFPIVLATYGQACIWYIRRDHRGSLWILLVRLLSYLVRLFN